MTNANSASTAVRLAVLMPAYNAERHIGRAVQSVLDGTSLCDLFIVDDGSTIPVETIVAPHPRIRIVRLQRNGGICQARNAGLRAILAGAYEFVALLDADDINRPHRFATQIAFMDANPHIAVVGAWGQLIEEETERPLSLLRTPSSPAAIKRTMLSKMCVGNSTSLMRASVLREVGLYSEAYPAAEDYELFRRIGARFAMANIPEVLIDVRQSRNGISLRRRHRQVLDRLLIQLKYFEPRDWFAWLGLARSVLLLLLPTRVYLAGRAAARHMRAVAALTTGRPYLAN